MNSIKDNETRKFEGITSDFKNQNRLVEYNYTKKINDLINEKNKKDNSIKITQQKLDENKKDHESILEKKIEIGHGIKQNMEDLSKHFSKQLSEIQLKLQEQIDNITKKWEGDDNVTEHLKNYENYVKTYDIDLNKDYK
jgi:hypothetical protein